VLRNETSAETVPVPSDLVAEFAKTIRQALKDDRAERKRLEAQVEKLKLDCQTLARQNLWLQERLKTT